MSQKKLVKPTQYIKQMLTLKPHQQKIVDEDKKKALLGLGTGVGKTVISLSLARGRTLIVVKKQQRVDKTFETTLEKFGIDLDIKVVTLDEFKKMKKQHYDTLIIDEAHEMLNGAVNYFHFLTFFKPSKICKALLDYNAKFQPERIYLLSATIDASAMSVYNACRILGVHHNIEQWIKAFFFLRNQRYVANKTPEAKERIVKVIQKLGYCMTHSDHTEVPEQTYTPIYVPLTTEQVTAIKQAELDYPDALQLVGKKYQIEQGVLKGNQFTESQSFPTHKDTVILMLAKEHKQMIIFANYTEQISHIQSILKKYNVHTLTGETKKKEREVLLANLHDTDEYILIVNTKIAAGWELNKCSTMVFASLDYSAWKRIQAEGRIQRANNLKKNTYIDIITKGGVHEAIYKSIKLGKSFNEKLFIKNK